MWNAIHTRRKNEPDRKSTQIRSSTDLLRNCRVRSEG
jgi:hypothetical protein